jgi:hypothetical protein
MQKYELTIMRENRVLIGFALIVLGAMGFIFLAAKLGSFIWFVIFLAALLGVLYYFLLGQLTVTATNDDLQFEWTKKLFFNYKDIEPVKYDDIKTLIIDNGQFLRKIITSDRTIVINTSKIKPKDSTKLINRLTSVAKKHNIETIDSWDVSIEKSYVRALYWINNVVLILVGIIMIVYISVKGFNSRLLPMMFLLFPQVYFMTRQMKQKMDKKKLQHDTDRTTTDKK